MIVAVDPYLIDWLDLVFRWLHVIAGIVWIGTSFYFVALDNHLEPPKRREDAEAGVAGEAWEVHGGGFYLVQKFRVAPQTLPETLHWFKWEAYTTWLSGFALFCVLYYVDADLNLVGADMSERAAIVVSLALLAAAWLVYDVLCRVKTKEEALTVIGRFMQYYRENAKWLERTYDFVPRVGIERLREILVNDSFGICERLDRDIQASIDAYVDPWLERDRPAFTGQFEDVRSIPLPVV